MRIRLIDACGHRVSVNMTLAEYHYRKWCEKHHILAGLLGAFTFESPYWLYFRIKYR